MSCEFDKTGVDRLVELAGASVAEIQTEIRRRCQRRIGHRGGRDIDAAVQEVMVILLKRRTQSSFDPVKGEFWGFVNGVISHVRSRTYRDQPREVSNADLPFLMDAPSADWADPVRAAIHSEFREAVLAVAKQLTPIQREALSRIIDRANGGRPTLHPEVSTEYVQEYRVRLLLKKLLAKFDYHVN